MDRPQARMLVMIWKRGKPEGDLVASQVDLGEGTVWGSGQTWT